MDASFPATVYVVLEDEKSDPNAHMVGQESLIGMCEDRPQRRCVVSTSSNAATETCLPYQSEGVLKQIATFERRDDIAESGAGSDRRVVGVVRVS